MVNVTEHACPGAAAEHEAETVPVGGGGGDPSALLKAASDKVQQALASGSPANNPRVPSEAEIGRLYLEIWK